MVGWRGTGGRVERVIGWRRWRESDRVERGREGG